MTMSTWREPETYNSQGLVWKTDSLNSSQAKLISQPGSDSSLDSYQEEIVPKLFLAMSNGLHPSLITEMFQSSKSSKQVTQFLANIFTMVSRLTTRWRSPSSWPSCSTPTITTPGPW